jgi:hypothetical protein
LPDVTGGRGGNGGGNAAFAPGGAPGGGRNGGAPGGGRQGAPGAAATPPPATTQTPPAGRESTCADSAGAAAPASNANSPGLYRATLPGGHTLAIMIADIATGEAKEVWHPEAGSAFGNLNNITWAGDQFIFTQLAKPTDESNSYYSLSVTGKSPAVQLTTTVGLIEDATAAALSKDGKTLYYCTNTDDIDRRHIWSVPTSGRNAGAGHDGRRHRETCPCRSRPASRWPC